MKESKAKVKVIKRQESYTSDDHSADMVVVPLVAEDRRFKADPIPNQVAKSSVFYRNWKYPGAEEDFPYSISLRYVQRMYPYAQPAPLLFDMADTEEEIRECKIKAEKLKARGVRYLWLKPGQSLHDAMQQLGEL